MKNKLKKLIPVVLGIALLVVLAGSTAIKASVELPNTQVDFGDSFTARIVYPKVNRYLAIHDGDNVVTHTASTSTALLWKFVKQVDGSYEIMNVKYNQCLTVAGASGTTGANVQIATDEDTDSQRWYIYNVEGKYVFQPVTSINCVLDVKGASIENLANVQLYSYNKSSAQLFDIKKTADIEEDSTQVVESTTLEETTSLEETTETQNSTTEQQTSEEPTTEEPTTEEVTTEEPTTEETTTAATVELPTTASVSYTSQGYSTASSGDTDGLSCVLYAPQNNTIGISTYVNLGGINTTLYTNSETLALQNSGSGIASDRNVDNAYLYLCLNSANWSGDFGLIKRLGSSDWEICTSEYKDGSWRWNAYSHSSDVTVTYDSNYIYKQWNVMDGINTYYIKNSTNINELQMNLVYNNGTMTYSLVVGTTTIFSVSDTGTVSDAKFGRAASITNSNSPTYTNENYLYLISSSVNGRTQAAMTNVQFANTYYYTTAGYAPLTVNSGSLWIYPSQTSSAGYLTNQLGKPIVNCNEATLTNGVVVDIIDIQNY